MRIRIGAALAALLVGALAAGCGSSDDDSSTSTQAADTSAQTTTAAADKAANVAWLTYSYLDYQQAEEKGIKGAVVPTGGSVKVFNANFDPSKLQQQCQDAVTSGRYNVIVISPVSPPAAVPCVTAAKAANIPVITLEGVVGKDPNKIEPQVDGVVGALALIPEGGAKTVTEMTTTACAGKDPCRVIADVIPGDPFGEADLAGLQATPGVDIVQKINSVYDNAQMQKLAPDALSAHPDADVLFTMGDNTALAAVPAVKAAGLDGKIKIIAMGGSHQGAQAVRDGVMFATAATWPETAGKLVGEMAVKAVNGQTIEPTGIDGQRLNKPLVVTQDTVDQFKAEWGPPAS